MNLNLELLKSLREDIENKEEMSHEANNEITVRGIIKNINVNLDLSGERSFGYRVVSLGRSSAEEVLGGVTREEITLDLVSCVVNTAVAVAVAVAVDVA